MTKKLLPKKTLKKISKADDKVAEALAARPPPKLGKTKEDTCINFLGFMGTMVSASKSSYHDRNPTHQVFFNANLYDSKAAKLWYGDLDLTKSRDRVQALCNALGERIYVTREQPYRFVGMFGDDERLTTDLLERDAREPNYPAVIIFNPEEKP
jgi:hypothetical protein